MSQGRRVPARLDGRRLRATKAALVFSRVWRSRRRAQASTRRRCTMRAVRFLSLAILMVVGFAGVASAQYNNTPGVYHVNVGVVPALLPAGSLPPDFPSLGPDLFEGTLTVT